MSGKANNSRRSRREEAQIESGKKSQSLVTSSPTSELREDATPYRVAGGAGVPPAGSGGVPAASSETPGADARSTRRRDACATLKFIDLFCGIGTIGLTAGASAPPAVVADIVTALGGLGSVQVSERVITTENIRFSLPKEVRQL